MLDSDVMSILFVLQTVGHPRESKRIKMLSDSGFKVRAVAFSRGKHVGRSSQCPTDIIGNFDDGYYWKRLFVLLSSVGKLKKHLRHSTLIYASGFDMLFLSLLTIKLCRSDCRIVYEVGDIRNLQTRSGVLGSICRFVDRIMVRRVHMVVSTSLGFINGYYTGCLGIHPRYLICENKLEGGSMLPYKDTLSVKNSSQITIGYFGILRCLRSIEILCKLAKSQPNQIQIVFAGVFTDDDYHKLIVGIPNIKYLGPYKSPNDLSSLYDQVDIVWACYPFPEEGDKNWQWARTNRFYESCYHRKPVIYLKGSGDEDAIILHGIGMPVEDSCDADVLEQFKNLNHSNLATWRSAVSAVDEYVYTLGVEGEQLTKAIDNNLHLTK